MRTRFWAFVGPLILILAMWGGYNAISAPLPTITQSAQVCDPNSPSNCLAPTSGGALPITGTISATNPSVSATAAAVPGSATYIGGNQSGNLVGVNVDGSNNLDVNCAAGCAGGTFNNNADGVATSATNGQSATWLYGFNGTTFDRLRVDGSKNLDVNINAATASVTAAQATAANLNATVVGTGTFATQSAITAASGSIASGAIASGAVASGAYASGSISDGAEVTIGNKADAKSTATDTTAISAMSVLKEISNMEQNPASRAVTNAGTFATQSAITAASGSIASGAVASGAIASGAFASGSIGSGAIAANAFASGSVPSGAYSSGALADGAITTLGAKTDAKNAATDTTAVSAISVLKEISSLAQSPAALPANQSVNVNQIGGSAVSTAASGTQKVGITGNAGAAVDAATGAAPPANVLYQGVNGSGATGGHVVAPIICDNVAKYDASTNGSTNIIAKVASQNIYICGFNLLAAGTVNVKFISGTLTTNACDTSTVTWTPAYQLVAQAGMVDHVQFGNAWKVATNTDFCINTSAGQAVQALVYYAQF